jgi:hypothetical protein
MKGNNSAFLVGIDMYAHNVYLFNGQDAKQLREDINRFHKRYDACLEEALQEAAFGSGSIELRKLLYRQSCAGLYSLQFLFSGWLTARKNPLNRMLRELNTEIPGWSLLPPDDQQAIVLTWIKELASDIAIERDFPDGAAQADRHV